MVLRRRVSVREPGRCSFVAAVLTPPVPLRDPALWPMRARFGVARLALPAGAPVTA